MANELTAQAQWGTGMRFDVTSGSGHQVVLDASKANGGQDSGPSPMEVILVGLAGCTGIDVISTLVKMRQSITAYEIRVQGARRDEHPRVYTNITVEHIVTGHDVQPSAVQRAISLSEEKYCSVSAMLDKTATITHTFQIIDG